MLQLFQPYYKRQLFSISRYFHIKSSLSYESIIHSHQVEEWLDSHCYSLKPCPSQAEEMVPVGALCFSNLFMHAREELKFSIMLHPYGSKISPKICRSLMYTSAIFLPTNRKQRCYLYPQKSKQEQIINFFKTLYDGEPQQYPQGSMMLFIPLTDNSHYSKEYRSKIMFNHDNSTVMKRLFALEA